MIRGQGEATVEPGPDDALGRVLALSAKASREWFEARLGEAGGSLPTWIVLSQAIEAPVSPSQRELAARMGIGGATLVRHLDRLEADGLVVRRRDRDDRRITRVDITPAGRRRHQELAVVAGQVDREVRALMSDEEERVFRSVLLRLGQHAAGAPRTAGPPTTLAAANPAVPTHAHDEETDVA
jgi:MarR family transcriptional regulator, transcriptional regulator for hemolysin